MASDCGLERRQPMAVGTQDIGQDIGIAWVALGGDGAIARPASLYDIGMDWRDKEPGIDETIDDEAARALDGDRCLRRRSPSPKPGDKIGKPIKIMRYQEAFEDFTGAIEHADGVARSAPVETDEYGHIGSPASRSMIPSAGSPYGKLINRRSGQILAELPVAHLPVARYRLPATATPQVSCGPSRGKQLWRSSRRRGTDATPALKLIQPRQGEVGCLMSYSWERLGIAGARFALDVFSSCHSTNGAVPSSLIIFSMRPRAQ